MVPWIRSIELEFAFFSVAFSSNSQETEPVLRPRLLRKDLSSQLVLISQPNFSVRNFKVPIKFQKTQSVVVSLERAGWVWKENKRKGEERGGKAL